MEWIEWEATDFITPYSELSRSAAMNPLLPAVMRGRKSGKSLIINIMEALYHVLMNTIFFSQRLLKAAYGCVHHQRQAHYNGENNG